MSFFGPASAPVLNEASAPLVRRALQRARIVGNFATVQVIVQVIGFASGILIVRRLDQREYAYFTIANTMQGTINVLADIGISIGLLSIGGRVWRERARFSQLISTALHLRRKLGLVAILAITPVLYFMLVRNGASTAYALLLMAIVLAAVMVQFSVGVLSVIPRLRSDIGKIQAIDLSGAIGRIVLLVAFSLFFLNAGIAAAIGSGALLLQDFLLRRYARRIVDLDAPQSAEDRAAMRGFIKSQAANAIFFCVQGHITVFLISFFAKRAGAVAEVGALSRLAMIFAVLSHLLTNIFAPAFARCQSPRRLRWQYAGVVGAVAAFSAALIAAALLFPHALLFVLGNKYMHLERELVWMIAGSVASALTGTLWALNASKAWIAGSWMYIPLTLATQIALIPFTDFGSIRSVLIFNLISALPSLLLNMTLSYRGFRSLSSQAAV